MKKYNFTDNNGQQWERITKTTARKLFVGGQSIVICADNLQPFGFWSPGCELVPYDHYNDAGAAFEQLTASYVYYNCINAETGRRPAFYKKLS